MQVFESASELSTFLGKQRKDGKTIGFVPTMGALHEGHLSLITHARKENDLTVISIFINPTQFNNKEDLEKYPRVVEEDLVKLESIQSDVVFLPDVKEMYPEGVQSEKLDLNGLDTYMEGKFRPGHFEGVATIVKRFFEIIKPDRAYFGEKDFQQLLIIRHINNSLNLGIEIVAHPTERSRKGLALSSRNELLNPEEKEVSLIIPGTLEWARKNYSNYTPSGLKQAIAKRFENAFPKLEYVEISNSENLEPVHSWNEAEHVRIFIAAFTGKVRLIDNVSLF